MREWTSVRTRKPEENGKYLVTVEDKSIITGTGEPIRYVQSMLYNDGAWWRYGERPHRGIKVIAWMVYPKPYIPGGRKK